MTAMCADCGGFDIEWMYRCYKHGTEYCRGCECPCCAEENEDEDFCQHGIPWDEFCGECGDAG